MMKLRNIKTEVCYARGKRSLLLRVIPFTSTDSMETIYESSSGIVNCGTLQGKNQLWLLSRLIIFK